MIRSLGDRGLSAHWCRHWMAWPCLTRHRTRALVVNLLLQWFFLGISDYATPLFQWLQWLVVTHGFEPSCVYV